MILCTGEFENCGSRQHRQYPLDREVGTWAHICAQNTKPSTYFFIDSKFEELVHFLQVTYPKLCQHWHVIWMMAAAMLVLTVVLGLYNSYNSCVEQDDGPLGRSTCSAAQRDSWWSSGLQQEQPTEQ